MYGASYSNCKKKHMTVKRRNFPAKKRNFPAKKRKLFFILFGLVVAGF